MAFFPALVTYPSMLGEIYSAAFTAPAFNWLCSPACTELETIVMDWVAKALRLPDCFLSTSSGGGGGVIHGSASEAIVTVMVVARERYLRLKADEEGLGEGSKEREDRISYLRGKLVAVSSDQAHSSTQKGAIIAGTQYRSIATSLAEDLALTAPNLRKALETYLADGLEPFYLTLSLGTTGTCAVDDFAAITDLRVQYPNLWIHVDAAFAGAALILPKYQDLYSNDMGRVADSFNFNMAKWLLVNFDASCLFVQNRNHLTRALTVTPSYLQNSFTDSGLVTDYRDWQIPLGRRFRALKIWFVMRTYGVEGMKNHIQNSITVGDAFRKMVEARKDLFEIVAPPRFALTCLRIKPKAILRYKRPRDSALLSDYHEEDPIFEIGTMAVHADQSKEKSTLRAPSNTNARVSNGVDRDAESLANQLTQMVAERVNAQNEIFITPSTTAGKTFIRVVSGNPNSSVEYATKAFNIIVKNTEKVLNDLRA